MSKEPKIIIEHKLSNLLLDLDVEFEDKGRIHAELFHMAGSPYHLANYIDHQSGEIHAFYRFDHTPKYSLYLKGSMHLSTDSEANITVLLIPSIERVAVRNSIDNQWSWDSGMGFGAIAAAMKRLEKFNHLLGFTKDGVKIPYDPSVLEEMIYQGLSIK